MSGNGAQSDVVVFDGVSRWYGAVLGLNKVTVRVGPGITGLLGPNGAGKSTFMKLLTGQIRPSSGQIHVLGEPVWDNPRLMRRVGYCPEIDEFYEDRTGLDFVALMTRLHGFPRQEARDRAAQALEVVRLADAMHKPIGKYSKGMRQKCKLAQALAHDPDLLLLDEPFTGTDPLSRAHLIELLRDLAQRRGLHVIVSSHVLHEIEALTRTLLLIEHGRVLAEGSVRDVRELIDDHPHRVRLTCDDPRRLAALLVAQPFVSSVRVGTGERLDVETPSPSECYRHLPRVALDAGIHLYSLESPDNSMEAVFRYLVAGGPRLAPGADL